MRVTPQDLLDCFRFALAENDPAVVTGGHLPELPRPPFVLAVGKAAPGMARAAAERYAGASGLIVAPRGAAGTSTAFEVLEASHPTPDESSLRAALAVRAFVQGLTPDDTLLVLLSGGSSSLLAAPEGVTLAQKRAVTADLLRSGADISTMNAVRRSLSWLKGGGLLRLTRARVLTLLFSDVPGDDPAVIGSGPSVPSSSTAEAAIRSLRDLGLAERHPEVVAQLERRAGQVPAPILARAEPPQVIASGTTLLASAECFWTARGWPVLNLGAQLGGEARELAGFHAALAASSLDTGRPRAAPFVLLSGGEASVTVTGSGRGGRNQEFLLWLLQRSTHPLWALAVDTDGIDGNTPAAGAWLSPDTWGRVTPGELRQHARDNDAHALFAGLGQRVVTGPTGNNLNDLRVLLVDQGA